MTITARPFISLKAKIILLGFLGSRPDVKIRLLRDISEILKTFEQVNDILEPDDEDVA